MIFPAEKSLALRAAVLTPLLLLAFAAAPVAVALVNLPSEGKLTKTLAMVFGGLVLPVTAGLLALWLLGRDSKLRAQLDLRVAAGARPHVVLAPTLGRLALLFALTLAITSGLLAMALRKKLSLGGSLAGEGLATASAVFPGALAAFGIAAVLVARAGKPWILAVAFLADVLARALPGNLVWLSPSLHVSNLLGVEPPKSAVPVSVLGQSLSFVVLLTLGLSGLFFAALRYRGRPR